MLGSCSHSMMKAVFIERHNAAAGMILKLVLEGSHGNCYILADVGSASCLGNLRTLDSRVPEWLITDMDLLCEGVQREQLRPGIMSTTAQSPTMATHGMQRGHTAIEPGYVCRNQGRTAWILEVGYCAATPYNDKLAEKQQQHASLVRILQRKGFTVHVLPVLLGNTGEISKSPLASIQLAGADVNRVNRIASRLSTHAQKSMQSIIQSRRVAELSQNAASQFTCGQFEPP